MDGAREGGGRKKEGDQGPVHCTHSGTCHSTHHHHRHRSTSTEALNRPFHLCPVPPSPFPSPSLIQLPVSAPSLPYTPSFILPTSPSLLSYNLSSLQNPAFHSSFLPPFPFLTLRTSPSLRFFIFSSHLLYLRFPPSHLYLSSPLTSFPSLASLRPTLLLPYPRGSDQVWMFRSGHNRC